MNAKAMIYRTLKYIERLQPRERVLILGATIVFCAGVGQGVLFLLNLQDHNPALEATANVKQQISINDQAIAAIIERQNSSKIEYLKIEQLQLKSALDDLKAEVQLTANYLIPPEEMPRILQNLLQRHSKLELVDFHTMPPIRLESVNEQLPIFNHGLSIQVNGTYLEMTSWLNDIEKLPWILNWDLLNYKMTNWPKGELSLEIHTLSREESWLDI